MAGAREEALDPSDGTDEGTAVDRLRTGTHPAPDDLGILDRRQERGRASEEEMLDFFRIGFDRQERGAERADAVGARDAEEGRRVGIVGRPRGRLGDGLGTVDGVHGILFHDVARRVRAEPELNRDPIGWTDRSPCAARIDQSRSPRPGGDQYGIGLDARSVGQRHPGHDVPRDHGHRGDANMEVGPAGLGEVRPGRGGG